MPSVAGMRIVFGKTLSALMVRPRPPSRFAGAARALLMYPVLGAPALGGRWPEDAIACALRWRRLVLLLVVEPAMPENGMRS